MIWHICSETRIFNFRFVDEIKHSEIIKVFEKSRLIVQTYNNQDKGMILTQVFLIQKISQRLRGPQGGRIDTAHGEENHEGNDLESWSKQTGPRIHRQCDQRDETEDNEDHVHKKHYDQASEWEEEYSKNDQTDQRIDQNTSRIRKNQKNFARKNKNHQKIRDLNYDSNSNLSRENQRDQNRSHKRD
jgi:hypothetical protein